MKNIKIIFKFCIIMFSLMCIMALGAYAVDITIYSKDSNNNYLYGATFELSWSSGSFAPYTVGSQYAGKVFFPLTQGVTYYVNVRKNGYVSNYLSFVCPSTATSYNVNLGSKTTYLNAAFVKPLSSFDASPQGSDISSGIGWRYLNGEHRFHTGIDIPKPANTAISSIQNGIVTKSTFDSLNLGYYLQSVTTSGTTYYARYCHMISASSYIVGNSVYTSNCIIGYVGNTGRSYGNHLHLDISNHESVIQSTAYDPTAFYP